jgi:DNA repair ATPase RecN
MLLENDNRVREIARIIGGTISDFSIEHARLMLEAGKNCDLN